MSFNSGGQGGRQRRRQEASGDSNRMPLGMPSRREPEIDDFRHDSGYRIRGQAVDAYRPRPADQNSRRPMDDYHDAPYDPIEPRPPHGRPQQNQRYHRHESADPSSDGRPPSAAERRNSRFEPAGSRNPFVNGAMIYRFVWGNPLCVRCGELGHLGNECENESLKFEEQKYLRWLVAGEQERSNRERERLDQCVDEMPPVPMSLPYRDEPSQYDGSDQYRRDPMSYGMHEEYERRESWPRRVGWDYQYEREPPVFYRDEEPRYGMPERYEPEMYHPSPSGYHPLPGREGYGRVPQMSPHMADAPFGDWQEPQMRPASEEQRRSTAWRSETPASSKNDGHDRPPLESQEDQFNQFKGSKKPSRKDGHPSAALPLPTLARQQSIMETTPDDSAVDMNEGKLSKKQKKKKLAKRKREEEMNSTVGSAKPNADPSVRPQIDHVAASKGHPIHTHHVATSANANPPPQLRLLPLGVNIPTKPIVIMGATMRLPNGEAAAVGPHPSTIRVSARYLTQAAIEKYLSPPNLDPQERSQAEAREDSLRLQGVAWIDNVRRALQLPVKTYTSACVFYHKFRLAHPLHEYAFADAAAASLLNACKAEDTLKKSRDILVAAYNLKQPAGHEQLSSDDPIFDGPSRTIIGLERLVLESSSFDFTNRAPHDMLVKVAKSLPRSDETKAVCRLAWTILTDIHRTFAPLKQTSATLSLACLELAAHFTAAASPDSTCIVRDHLADVDLNRWHTSREEIMEILLDALDMYTHHTTQTILGTSYSLDDFLRIRLALNKECTESNIPRHTIIQPPPSPDNTNGTGATLRVANGHPTPVSPPQPGTQVPPQPSSTIASLPVPEGGGTLRFMLNPQRATDERAQVSRYYTEEWEEYEEEIEVPITRDPSKERSDRDRDYRRREHHRDDRYDDRRSVRDDRPPPPPSLRDRDPLRERERDAERERARLRERDRDRRYDDRRYDDRGRDRRYDDRRDRDRDRDRRYYEDDRRRRDDRR